eukprot:TRINITY_DN36719_c0_g1_i1.p1 TRINITY_DN36719_c0_g1~~TRINITY_DN36719_c0_g1_i1.p1  ORF type:complete len:334 (+),score=102.39 TRINITY_DN36719_c0_g1_i1:233-1234(+)
MGCAAWVAAVVFLSVLRGFRASRRKPDSFEQDASAPLVDCSVAASDRAASQSHSPAVTDLQSQGVLAVESLSLGPGRAPRVARRSVTAPLEQPLVGRLPTVLIPTRAQTAGDAASSLPPRQPALSSPLPDSAAALAFAFTEAGLARERRQAAAEVVRRNIPATQSVVTVGSSDSGGDAGVDGLGTPAASVRPPHSPSLQSTGESSSTRGGDSLAILEQEMEELCCTTLALLSDIRANVPGSPRLLEQAAGPARPAAPIQVVKGRTVGGVAQSYFVPAAEDQEGEQEQPPGKQRQATLPAGGLLSVSAGLRGAVSRGASRLRTWSRRSDTPPQL